MNPADIRDALHARPFKKFKLCTADGNDVPITHPENLVLAAATAVAIEWNETRTESRTHIVGLPMITRLAFELESAE